MSDSKTRYPPLPNRYKTWQEWATNYIAFSGGGVDIKRPADPVPLLLAHQLGAQGNIGAERAVTDGVIMYNPINKKIVVSQDGIWKPISVDAFVSSALTVLMGHVGLTQQQIDDVLAEL